MFPFATTIPMIPSELFSTAPCYAPAPSGMTYYSTPVQPRHVVREPFQWKFEQGDEHSDRLIFTKNISASELRQSLQQYVAHQQSQAKARYDPFFGRYYYAEENEVDLSNFGKALSTKQFRDFAFELNVRGNELTVVKDNGEIAKVFELSNNYDDVAIEECDLIENKAVLVLSLKKPVFKTTKKVKTLQAPVLDGNNYLLHLQQIAAHEQEELQKQQQEAKMAREQKIKLAQEKRQKAEQSRKLKQEQERRVKEEEEEKAERIRFAAKQEQAKKEREQEIAKLLKEKLAKQQRLEAKKIEQRLKFEKEQEKLLARQKRMEIEQQRILAKQEELKKKYTSSLQNIDVDVDGDLSLDDSKKNAVGGETSPSIAAITVASVLSDLAKSDKESALESDDASVASTSSSSSSRKSSFKVEDIEDEEIAHYNSSLLNSPKSNAILEGI